MHNGITYVTGGSLDGENTALDVEEGNIESTTTKVVDQDVALLVGLAGTETVGNGSGGRLVDDTENVEARDGTSVLAFSTFLPSLTSATSFICSRNQLEFGKCASSWFNQPCREPWRRFPAARKSWSHRGTQPAPSAGCPRRRP
ncbi:hypothetical protein KC320_g118 [Hortaea werneckii]|nr:hypothetical protein KC320_g118 [Hortaea werneckii]